MSPRGGWANLTAVDTARGSDAADAGQRLLALIVEGTAPIGTVLAHYLTALGWRSVIARGPEHAQRLADVQAFDLLVADAELGDTTGESLAAGLIRHRARPVVLVSSLHASEGIELWPPAALMPTVHSIDTLFPALGVLFGQPFVGSWAEPGSPSIRH
jgi:CheY-like chemotaxis protein